MTNNPE